MDQALTATSIARPEQGLYASRRGIGFRKGDNMPNHGQEQRDIWVEQLKPAGVQTMDVAGAPVVVLGGDDACQDESVCPRPASRVPCMLVYAADASICVRRGASPSWALTSVYSQEEGERRGGQQRRARLRARHLIAAARDANRTIPERQSRMSPTGLASRYQRCPSESATSMSFLDCNAVKPATDVAIGSRRTRSCEPFCSTIKRLHRGFEFGPVPD